MAEFASRSFLLPEKGDAPAISGVLRSCLPEDAEKYLSLWQAVASETTHTLQRLEDGLPDPEKVRDNWRRTLVHPRELKLGAFVGDALIAQLGVYVGPPHAWTDHVARFGMMIEKKYWGRGLGRLLLQELEDYLRGMGVVKVEAQVRTENERAWKLYESVGYRIEGRRSRAAKIGDRYRDEYWIAKDLDS